MTTELTSELLLKAYAYGVFPMAKSRADQTVFWVQPKLRGVLPFEAFHIPRSLKKTIRKGPFTVTVDEAFDAVLDGCAETTLARPDTWINDQIVRLFTELHHAGVAHSVEVWRDGELAGGLYGLAMGSAFFGESMFSRVTDASKVGLVNLVAILKRGGFTLRHHRDQPEGISRPAFVGAGTERDLGTAPHSARGRVFLGRFAAHHPDVIDRVVHRRDRRVG